MNRIILLFFCNCMFNLSSAMEQDPTHPTKREAPESAEPVPKRIRQEGPASQSTKPTIRLIANDGHGHLIFEHILKQSPVFADLLTNKRRDVQEQLKIGKIDEDTAAKERNELKIDIDSPTLYLLTTLMVYQESFPQNFDLVIEKLKTQGLIPGFVLSGQEILEYFTTDAMLKAHAYSLPVIAQNLAELILTPHNMDEILRADARQQITILEAAPLNKVNFLLFMELFALNINRSIAEIHEAKKDDPSKAETQTALISKQITPVVNKLVNFMVTHYLEINAVLPASLSKLSTNAKKFLSQPFSQFLQTPIASVEFPTNVDSNVISNGHLISISKKETTLTNLETKQSNIIGIQLDPNDTSRYSFNAKLSPDNKLLALRTTKFIFIYDLTNKRQTKLNAPTTIVINREPFGNFDWLSNEVLMYASHQQGDMYWRTFIYNHKKNDNSEIFIAKWARNAYALRPDKALVAFIDAATKIKFLHLDLDKMSTKILQTKDFQIANPQELWFDETGDSLIVTQKSAKGLNQGAFIKMGSGDVKRCKWEDDRRIIGSIMKQTYLSKMAIKGPLILSKGQSGRHVLQMDTAAFTQALQTAESVLQITNLDCKEHVLLRLGAIPDNINFFDNKYLLINNITTQSAKITIVPVKNLVQRYAAKQILDIMQ